MVNYLTKTILLIFLLLLVGCGNQGDPGDGNTVFIQSTIKSGTTGAVFSNVSGFTFRNTSSNRTVTTPNSMSFVIKSVVYPKANAIPASDVNIYEIDFSYNPLVYSPGKLSPTFIPSVVSVPYSGSLTAGGSLDIDNVPIIWPTDIAQIISNAGTAGVAPNSVLQYRVDVTFKGTEVNTGINLSNTINVGAFVQLK